VLSIADPDARSIHKGTLGEPNEFRSLRVPIRANESTPTTRSSFRRTLGCFDWWWGALDSRPRRMDRCWGTVHILRTA